MAAVSNLTRNRSFRGGGGIYLRDLSSDGTGYFFLGNADNFQFAINEETQNQRNFTVPGGGNIASTSTITDVTASVNALSINPRTAAVALRALIQTRISEAVTGETVTAYKDMFIPFARVPDTDQTITVTDSGAVTTYTAGTDYLVRNNGIFIANDGTITDAQSIIVNYTAKATYDVESLTRAAVEYEVFFDGFNEADNGKAVTVTCYRTSFTPTQALSLIQEDFGALPFEFQVLADSSRGGNDSQYFTVKFEQ